MNGTEIDGSVRRTANVTAFRYLLIESDSAPRDLWIAMMVQLHAPIVALYESGKRSVHALIRVDAFDEIHYKEIGNRYRRELIPLGADECSTANKVVQLSRLPGAVRRETGRLQRLLYLAPDADGRPILGKRKSLEGVLEA